MAERRSQDPGGEWLDVVDRRNQVVGRERRGVIHRRGLLHRAVHMLLQDGAGRFFLQRRSFTKDTFPGRWDSSASGHVDSGEDYDTAMRRELGEELGWTPPAGIAWPRPCLCFPAQPLTGNEFVHVYAGPAGKAALQPHPDEIIEGRWLAPPRVDAWLSHAPHDFADAFRLLWPLFRLQVNNV